MKNIFIFICLILATFRVSAQSGTGISSDPYWGDISTTSVWSLGVYPGDIVYIGTSSNPDLRVITNGHLSIDPGMTIVFKELGSDLIITETGQLTAGGPGTVVRFTKDASKTNWGHISFESMGSAGASLINNCIIEYGDVSNISLPNRYGGGIHTSFTNLTISNCIIRNNKAGWGGGIFVNKNASPTITNCSIQNNTSISSGGGLYIWSNSVSIVTNCLIFNNSSTSGGGGGGIFLGDLCGNVRIYNSTIVNNSAAASGKNIHLYINTNSERPTFINCIIWNPENSIAYTTQTPASSDFVNCAIQSPLYTSYTNWVPLNSSNNLDGPNFNKTDGTDWSLKVISPCRDAGITTDPTVPTDYIGNSRIGVYDIGAYEVQYNGWKTSAATTDWNTSSNWDMESVPGSSSNVVIPTGAVRYPVGSLYTIGSGYGMVLDPGAQLTMTSLINNGNLKLRSDASNISSLITSSAGVSSIVELYLTGKETSGINKWHYISSPVNTLTTGVFTTTTNNLARFVESLYTGNANEGWIAYDGYNYKLGKIPDPPVLYKFTTLWVGKGYDYFYTSDHKYTFSGILNTSDVTDTLFYSGVSSTLSGFNLLGNPFSSGLDWDYITTHGYPDNTSKSLYFTKDNSLCSYISGVGSPPDVNGIIPPMQGFFTKTYVENHTLVIPAAARTQTGIHARYKGSEIIPLVRLSLQDGAVSDETVIRFDEMAKAGLDNDFDALKMFLSSENTSIYSSVSGVNYVINGQPFPDISVDIPIAVNLLTTGNHTITTTQLQGLDTYNVLLIDHTTGFSSNLKTTPILTFSSAPGLISDRFILKITNIATGTENPAASQNDFNIYSGFNSINIQTLSDEWDGKQGSVTILDLAGKKVSDNHNTEFSKNSVIRVVAPISKGLYLVELRSGLKRYVRKVVIK